MEDWNVVTNWDVVIIGSGPSGASTAEILVNAGVRVLMLEAGQRPPEDRFAVLESTLLGGIPWKFEPYQYEMRGDDVELNEFAVRMLGGSSLAWGAITPRFHASDFRMKSLYGVGEDWPLTYDELEPFYCEAESLMGISGNADSPYASPRSAPYPMPAFPMNDTDELVRRAGEKMGIKFHSAPVARNSVPYKNRSACVYYSTCRACPVGGMYSSDKPIVALEQFENFKLIVGAEAQRIELGSDGQLKRVIYRDEAGTEHAAYASRVVVATQTVEAVRLLLNSETSKFPQGLANENGILGHYLMEHPKFYVWGKVKERLNPYKQGFETCTTFKFHDHPRRGEYAGGRLLVRENAGPQPADVAQMSGQWGNRLKDEVKSLFGHYITLGSFLEQLPRAENRVSLSTTVSQHGLPAARVDFKLEGDYEREGFEQMRQVKFALLEELGATDIEIGMKPSNSGHYMGGHRMGNDPNTSTTNSYMETHSVKGLYLASGGAFPTAGVSNPTLTTVALCLRMAHQMLNH